MGGGGGGCLFEAGRLLTFSAFRMSTYLRWVLIRGWTSIRIKYSNLEGLEFLLSKFLAPTDSRKYYVTQAHWQCGQTWVIGLLNIDCLHVPQEGGGFQESLLKGKDSGLSCLKDN